jgi:hypothetical protein
LSAITRGGGKRLKEKADAIPAITQIFHNEFVMMFPFGWHGLLIGGQGIALS